MNRAPVVTGLGCLCAAGNGLPEVVRALEAGVRRCAPPARFTADLERVYPVFEITSALDESSATGGRTRPSRCSRLALLATLEACREAGLESGELRRRRVGVCLGTTVGCTLNDEPFYREFKQGAGPKLEPIHRYLANNPALFLAETLGLSGPVATLANACSSGTDAVGLARSWLRGGLCELVIAGGTDELSRITYLGFIHLLIAAQEPCRPFDAGRTGLNLGEGAGVLILETRESARERGARALATVAGYGCAADAWHPTAPHPEGKGLRRAIGQALLDAGTRADKVDFINAHGTSTPDNDRIEGAALADLFPHAPPVVATKAFTGHTLGAAGGIEAVLTVQALRDQRLPATPGFERPDPACRITPTTRNIALRAEVGLSDSLAFGGTNSALVLRRED